MAGCGKAPPGRALGVVVLAVAALFLAAAAVDDEHMYHWKCFKSCTGNCQDDDVGVANDGNHSSSGGSNVSAVSGGKCKDRCLNECFEDLPAVCYHQCVVTNCLCFPPFSKEKVTCLKSCCDKCFHHGPPAPGPGPKPPAPMPPSPGPGPKPPKPPSPGPPKPPAPKPPKPPSPGPPTPKPPAPKPKPKPPPKPCPPAPKPKPKPKPKPQPKPKPNPPTPKAPPPPKKPCPCPPGSQSDGVNNN